MVRIRIDVEAEECQMCAGCDSVVEEGDAVSQYECNSCGNEQEESGQCEECRKFVSKKDEEVSECCSEPLVTGYKVAVEDGNDALYVKEDDCEVVDTEAT